MITHDRFALIAARLLLAMRCHQHHMPHVSLDTRYKKSSIAVCRGMRSLAVPALVIGGSLLGPATRLLHAPDVTAEKKLLRALSMGFASMSIHQFCLIS